MVQGGKFRDLWHWQESGLTFWPHIIDVWHVPSGYVACEGLSDLGHGPNQPTATIIGEYSASCHRMVHWYLLQSGREFQDLTKIWPNFLTTHHCWFFSHLGFLSGHASLPLFATIVPSTTPETQKSVVVYYCHGDCGGADGVFDFLIIWFLIASSNAVWNLYEVSEEWDRNGCVSST